MGRLLPTLANQQVKASQGLRFQRIARNRVRGCLDIDLLFLRFLNFDLVDHAHACSHARAHTCTPPPPTTIKTANEGRFRLNVDSPYGERAQSTVLTRAPPRRPARPRWDFIFNLSMRESKAWQAPSPFAFTMPEEERAFDSVSAHLLATAANIFGWAGDPTK